MIKIAISLVIIYMIVSYFLRQRGIQIGLTPFGKTALFKGGALIIRLMLRKIGF